jgi:predicted Zn-dependent protease
LDEFPKALDLARIFTKLRSLGATDIELYAELRRTNRLDVWDRVHRVESRAEKGLSIFCRKGTTEFHFSCNPTDTDAVLKLIEGKRFLPPSQSQNLQPPPRERVALPSNPASPHAPHAVTVLNLARAAFAQGQGKVSHCDLLFEEQRADFWIAHHEDGWRQGSTTTAHIRADWKVEQAEGPPRVCSWERYGLDPDSLVEGLKTKQWLFEEVRRSAGKSTPWPAPQGELPIFWSAGALAKVLLPFVRAFEADLFLKQESFLQTVEFPARWPLTLSEKVVTRDEIDCQGTPRIELTLLKNGKPRGLACDKRSAAELQVEATGHARRTHFRSPPVTGLWNLTVDMDDVTPQILDCSPWGVWIEDIQILESSTKTGLLCLSVNRAHLLHEKSVGETIEPVVFEMAVQDFLGIIQTASEQSTRFGFSVDKEDQSFITEMELPDVFTPGFPYPGSVPTDTYW